MIKYVYVVTSTELGWDCVCAVYDNKESAEQHVTDCGECYIIHIQRLQSKGEEEYLQ